MIGRAQTAGLDLSALPPLLRLEVELVAEDRQRLGPLPSNALRGGLGAAIARDPGLEERLGVRPAGLSSDTADGPAPLIVGGPFAEGSAFFELSAGQAIRFSIILVGQDAIEAEPALVRAVGRAAEEGLGVGADRRVRPRLHLDRVRRARPRPAPTGRSWRLDFRSPLRLRIRGEDRVAPEPAEVWEAMLRRADQLARSFGGGPLCPRRQDVPCPTDGGWDLADPAAVRRYSSRQRRGMTWVGTTGLLCLRGPAALGPLVAFLSEVGLGKGAAQGFGRFRVVGSGDP